MLVLINFFMIIAIYNN